MNIQNIVTDVRKNVESAGKNYQDAFKTYIDTQRQAVTLVRNNGQSLANTEIGAAKNIYASAKASFERARRDGLRQVANNPQAYLPSGRAQIVSAYKTTIDLLVKTGNEFTSLVTDGYRNIVNTLTGKPAKKVGVKKPTVRKAKRAAKNVSDEAQSAATKAKRATTKAKKTASSAAKKTAAAAPAKATKRKTSTTRAKKTGSNTTASSASK